MTIWNRLIPFDTHRWMETTEGEALVASYNWCVTNSQRARENLYRDSVLTIKWNWSLMTRSQRKMWPLRALLKRNYLRYYEAGWIDNGL